MGRSYHSLPAGIDLLEKGGDVDVIKVKVVQVAAQVAESPDKGGASKRRSRKWAGQRRSRK